MTPVNSLITDNLDTWTSAIKKRSATGRGSSKKIELTGIKKLRELILELAVRGQLVAQDPNDEPASVLLEKIAAEKAQLIKDKKIKKPKVLPEIGEDEKLFNLPEHWCWARFGNIAQHNSGKTLDKGRNSGNPYPYLTTSNLYWGKFDLKNVREMLIENEQLEKCTAKKNDLLICEGGEAGRAAVWEKDIGICFQNHIHRARFYSEISPFFMFRFFEQLTASGEINNHRKGVGISNMSGKSLALIITPLPPLAEQHRIVAKVDELMTLCDQLEQQTEDSITAHQTLVETLLATLSNSENPAAFNQNWARIAAHFDTLFTTEHSIDQLKQTILQLAVMGKLVPQNPNDLPAPQSGKWFVYVLECENGSYYKGFTQDILKRWKQHATGKGADWTAKYPPKKLVHWEEFNEKSDAIKREKELKSGYGRKWLTREIAAGRTRQAGEPASVLLEKIAAEKEQLIKDKKIKKQKPLPEITEDEKAFELPSGWEWSRLEYVALNSEAGWSPRCLPTPRIDGRWGVLKVSAVTWGQFNSNENKELPNLLEPRVQYEIKDGDFLISRANTAELVARAVIVPKDAPKKLMMSDKIIRFVLSSNIEGGFISLVNNSRFSRDYYAEVAGGTSSSMKNVSREQIRSLVIALPPLKEQHRIVKKVDELITLCDQLKDRLSDAQVTQCYLAETIVEQTVN